MSEAVKPDCVCCGGIVDRPDGDPWEGRMHGYCYDCALARCDCIPGDCGKNQRRVSQTLAPTETFLTPTWSQSDALRERLVTAETHLREALDCLEQFGMHKPAARAFLDAGSVSAAKED